MIRTAIIGVSGFAEVHYGDLMNETAAGRMKPVAATVINQEEEPDKCEKLRACGCRLFTDYRDMLSAFRGRLDLCMIPTGIHLHAPMSIDAMRAGSNVFVEKPAAALFRDVLAMQSVESETGKFVAVGYQDMFGKDVQVIKKALLENRVGAVRSIRGMGTWPRLDSYYARNAWAGRIKSNGRYVLDSPFNNALSHFLNMMLFFAGGDERSAANPERVRAELFRAHDIESCDTACLQIETREGPGLYFLVTHCSEKPFGPLIQVRGEKGTLEWTRDRPARLQFKDGGIEELPMEDPSILRKNIMNQLIARINDANAFICNLDTAGMQTLCAEAAHLSCEIVSVPAAHVLKLPEQDSVKTVIAGIDELFHKAFAQETPLSRSGAEWAALADSQTVETRVLREKRYSCRENDLDRQNRAL